MLAEKREELEEKKRSLDEALGYIDWKQGLYDEILSGKVKFYSHLCPKDFPEEEEERRTAIG